MQLSLLPNERLFDAAQLRQFMSDRLTQHVPNLDGRREGLKKWLVELGQLHDVKETSLEQQFNSRVLEGVLGYRLWPAEGTNAYPKPPKAVSGISAEPDVALGIFGSDGGGSIRAVLELKTPGTDLDRPQSGYAGKSPVDQAFEYGASILGVKWVLVSDMATEVRLYSVESPVGFERFALQACCADDERGVEAFRKLLHLLEPAFLVGDGETEPAGSRLLARTAERQVRIRRSFYQAYFEIRRDLFGAITNAAPQASRHETLSATQRLLDRLLFLFYCEDHPDHLIPQNTVKEVTTAARKLPGGTGTRVYEHLKDLFREVDSGSPSTSGLRITGYNGELFKHHDILDQIDLPDGLHDRIYTIEDQDQGERRIRGVWGLHEFDFWQELNEHLLGHVFEESLSDVVELETAAEVSLADKLEERRRHGVYFTDQLLADFLAARALEDLLRERALTVAAGGGEVRDLVEARLRALVDLRVIDPACGSGAFLVSSYQELLREFWRLRDAGSALSRPASQQLDLDTLGGELTQARLLRDCLHGVDLLPQAIEIAKLSLWLRSAHRGERIADLGSNLISANSLRVDTLVAGLGAGFGSFDLVIGNPPWGGEVADDVRSNACEALGLESTANWDSWELFLALGLSLLREGGRLAFVLPDTLLDPEKSRIRKVLLGSTKIERLHKLGSGWFGPNVRMDTMLLQARKGTPPLSGDFSAMLLTGTLRKQAIRGEMPLSQLEAKLSQAIPQERSDLDAGAELEMSRTRRDDEILALMESGSVRLAELCARGRGEEMSKAGLLWRCPSCHAVSTPGEKKKGGTYRSKVCATCGFALSADGAVELHLVEAGSPDADSEWFIDGDDIRHRYVSIRPGKRIKTNVTGFPYKNAALYRAPKIVIRQAGVGVWAALDASGARVPQSVYVYRLNPEFEADGYRHEFILGALLSRAMTYYVFKRFAEVDADSAHVKLTHARLESFPIPRVDFLAAASRKAHDQVVADVTSLLSGGSGADAEVDWRIEGNLRRLWGLAGDDGAYINGAFALVPPSQAIRELFPDGAPQYAS